MSADFIETSFNLGEKVTSKIKAFILQKYVQGYLCNETKYIKPNAGIKQ